MHDLEKLVSLSMGGCQRVWPEAIVFSMLWESKPWLATSLFVEEVLHCVPKKHPTSPADGPEYPTCRCEGANATAAVSDAPNETGDVLARVEIAAVGYASFAMTRRYVSSVYRLHRTSRVQDDIGAT